MKFYELIYIRIVGSMSTLIIRIFDTILEHKLNFNIMVASESSADFGNYMF